VGADLELHRVLERLNIPNPSDCDASLNKTSTAIDEKIRELEKQEPAWENGPDVEVGSCTSRLQKLFGKLGEFNLRVTSIAKQVANREARACLHLKREYLQNACKCIRKGITISTEEVIQDQSIEAFAAVKRLEQRARDHGVQSGIIRDIVERASEIRDCHNLQTIETLRSTERALRDVLKE
jgi:hypothetical protein